MDGITLDKNLEVIKISNIFNNDYYVIPIFQRNYAWGEMEIQQLIDDIDSSIGSTDNNYFLGNLIVDQKDNNVYEVIDGQQRLTTLYLLETYLSMNIMQDALRFEAREKSNRTLKMLFLRDKNNLSDDLVSNEILEGYKVINQYFKSNNINKDEFKKKLDRVFLVRVQVPKGINLNHYFEIMNTRGEQLELHEIAKAKFLEVLKTEKDKRTAALIWEKCSIMDSYIQMNFEPAIRKSLFTNDWSSLKTNIKDFDSISRCIPNVFGDERSVPLIKILENGMQNKEEVSRNEVENERFESVISFPNFLLQVNAVINEIGEEESSLDDKNFLNNLSWAWADADKAKNFLYHLLKCRVLFDKYIIKREYAKDYKETGKWSLQRLVRYSDKKGDKPNYIGTFGSEDSKKNKLIRTLQSCLRVTYTSPKTMHWISLVLTHLLEDESCNILEILEEYCKEKVKESDFEQASGFGFARIVFTYLDYLLYKKGYSYMGKEIITPMDDDWQFQFRNSIEHFQPQNPTEGDSWPPDDLDSFGNLALITVSGNSKFSNLTPQGKISSYPSIIEQSLKLKVMKELLNLHKGKWTVLLARKHRDEMFKILKE